MEALGQRVPVAMSASLSQVVCSQNTMKLPMSIRGSNESVLRVLDDAGDDGCLLLFCREFTVEIFLRRYRQPHQEKFEMLKIDTLVDFLMLRLTLALYDPWIDCTHHLRSCVISGHVKFSELRGIVSDLISVWGSIREFAR